MAVAYDESKMTPEERRKRQVYVNNIIWREKMENETRLIWEKRWPEIIKLNKAWICSDISRASRKPSLRSIDWTSWFKGQNGYKTPCEAERNSRKGYRFQSQASPVQYGCRPEFYPETSAQEVGCLSGNSTCALEIYGTKYLAKPPLPWWQKKISVEHRRG